MGKNLAPPPLQRGGVGKNCHPRLIIHQKIETPTFHLEAKFNTNKLHNNKNLTIYLKLILKYTNNLLFNLIIFVGVIFN